MKFLFFDALMFPGFLLAGIIFLILWALFLIGYKKHRNVSSTDLIAKIYGKNSFSKVLFHGSIGALIFCFFLFFSGPYQENSSEKIKKNGVDMVIVLDLSYSMLATDIAPNRLEAAKTVFTQFLEGLNQHRVGVVLFAGKAFQSLPLNYDTKFMEEFMNDLEIETLNQNHPDMQGTAIGDALMMAASLLQREENEREKVILLATDGEANKGLEPEIALQFVKKQGYKVYTIGIGKEKESTLLLRNALGFVEELKVGGVDEEILKKIASETGGKYFKADSQSRFQDILNEVESLEKKPLETEIYSFITPKRNFLLWGMALLFSLLGYLVFFKNIRVKYDD